MPAKPKALLMDANVLIDYQKSDLSVLGLAAKHVGEIQILTTTLDEVDGLDIVDCERLDCKVIEPDLAQLMRAATQRGRLSFRDHLCLIVASDKGLVCVTNDRSLRKACDEQGVATLWGLKIMITLVQDRLMRAVEAIHIAEKIHVSNPLHIPQSLLDRFASIVNDIEPRRRGK